MFYWLMTHDSDWKLSQEASNALYNEYFDGCHCYQDEIYREYHTAIDLTVSEIFDKYEEFEKDLTADGIVIDYLERTGVKLEHVKQNEAFYRPSTDSITMPLQEQFKTAGDYYSTLFHEITHSTGHKTRLDRISEMASFGSADYSTEELVAEIGSASILSTIGLQDSKTLEQSASYCKSWLKALKNDKKMIVIASARAEKAIQLILGI